MEILTVPVELRKDYLKIATAMEHRADIGIRCKGFQPIITDIPDREKAIQAVIDGSIQNHLDRNDRKK